MFRMRSPRSHSPSTGLGSLLVVLTMVGLAGARGQAPDVSRTFVPIEVPVRPSPPARAITADSRIVGFYGVVNGPQHQFLLADGIHATGPASSESMPEATSAAPLPTKTPLSMGFR